MGAGRRETVVLDLREEVGREGVDIGETGGLSAEERGAAVRNWRDRMVSEHASARVFAGMFDRLLRAGVKRRYLEMARAGIEEEMEHAVLCGRVLAALGEEAVAEMPELPQVERHEDASPIEAVLRDAISIGACSETVAVALVGAEREQAGSEGLRRVLDRILKDEIGHARLGWKLLDELLPRVNAGERRRLSAYLVAAFEHQIAFHSPFVDWPAMSDRGVAFGAPDGPANFRVFVETMTGVTVPGLAQRGLLAETAWGLALEGVQARAREGGQAKVGNGGRALGCGVGLAGG
ncbi:MAG: ferritin-like domain-containing protein [Polyangiaceae bacterium]